jgi:hypothetical protein
LAKRLEEAKGAKSEASPLAGLAGVLRRRGVILLLTDALGDLAALRNDLGQLTHRGHEVRLVQVLDDAEIDFPFTQAASFQDLESGIVTAADPIAIAEAYRHEVASYLEKVKAVCAARRVGYRLARTSDSLEGPLRFLLSGAGAGVSAPARSHAPARSR